jgi:aspartate aminotransferase
MALSGVNLDGVFMVRGAEGQYAEWLANPIPSGYHGFLLSTANVYPGMLTSLISKITAGAAGGNLLAAVEISSRISRCTDIAFNLVTGELAEGLGGNAFTNSAKAVDFWMAFGPRAIEEGRPLPLLKSGMRLPQTLVERVGDTLTREGLMPEAGYVPPDISADLRQPMFDPRATSINNEGAYKVLAKAQNVERGSGPWSSSNNGVVHFEIGQPDYPTPQHIKDAGARAIAEGKTTYTTPQGLLELRQSLCKHIKRTRGATLRPEEVYVGPGCKPGMYFVAQALLGAGDELLFPDPGFPQYNALATINGATSVPVPLEKDGSTFKWDKFDKAISSGKAKALIINSPSNPTGGIMQKGDVERVVQACTKHGVWLISDEIYSALAYDANRPFVSPLSVPGLNREQFVLIDGFSKTYCMTGWRLGWAVMPPRLGDLVSLLTVHAAGCTASFTQWAGIAALEGPQDCVGNMLVEYRRRRDYVVGELNSMPGVSCETPEGAFYAFPNVSQWGLPAQQMSDLILEEAGVATLPGTDFGRSGEGHIRISYVTDMPTLEKGMGRLRKFFMDIESGKYAHVMPIPPYYSSLGLSSLSADN